MPWQLIRFGLAGIANTLIGYGVILAAMHLGAGDYLANALGYLVGFAVSFALNRRFTFRVRGQVDRAEVARFAGAVAVAYACNFAVLAAARQYLGAGSPVAQLIAVAVYAVVFYLLSSRFVFRGDPA